MDSSGGISTRGGKGELFFRYLMGVCAQELKWLFLFQAKMYHGLPYIVQSNQPPPPPPLFAFFMQSWNDL